MTGPGTPGPTSTVRATIEQTAAPDQDADGGLEPLGRADQCHEIHSDGCRAVVYGLRAQDRASRAGLIHEWVALRWVPRQRPSNVTLLLAGGLSRPAAGRPGTGHRRGTGWWPAWTVPPFGRGFFFTSRCSIGSRTPQCGRTGPGTSFDEFHDAVAVFVRGTPVIGSGGSGLAAGVGESV